MRKKTIKITLAMIFAFLLILFLSSLWLASFTMTGKRQSYEEAMEWQSERYDTSFYPYHGRIPPLLSEAKVGDECRKKY